MATPDRVDLALLLAMDASASVTFEEFGLMASGLAAALRDPAVSAGLVGRPGGASLCGLMLFSGFGQQDMAIPWTRVSDGPTAAAFAQAVDDVERLMRAGLTATGDALQACADQLALLPAPAARMVVDVVADGRANDGPMPDEARDALVAAGATINGLCLLHEEPDLVEWTEAHVIGGPGAFAQACADYAGFADAMLRKLLREIA